jgi:hypothetical protein
VSLDLSNLVLKRSDISDLRAVSSNVTDQEGKEQAQEEPAE